MNKSIRIAWVCRDGYLDLFPLIQKEISKEINLNSFIVTHLMKDKLYLEEKYNLDNITILSESINDIPESFNLDSELIDLSKKYNTVPVIRMLWSTFFELDKSRDEIYDLAVKHFIFWEKFIKSTSIEILVYERPSILSTCIAWLICQKYGVKCIDYIDTPLDTMTIVDNLNGDYCNALKERFEQLSTKDYQSNDYNYQRAVKYFDLINTAPKKTNEALLAGEITDQRGRIGFGKIKNLINLFKNHSKEKNYYLYSLPIYKKLMKNILYICRYYFHRVVNIYDHISRSNTEKYFLYPLFMKGEWSNHIFMSPGYWDPINLIKNISVCLPPGHVLYVKEHYSGFADRKLTTLLKFKKIDNVKLIKHTENSFDLIQQARGIITLGSTMGFEAMLMSKPVILLGEPWYRSIPGIFNASRVEEIAHIMASIDELSLPTKEEKISIIRALYSISGPGIKFPREGTLDESNVKNMSKLFLEYFKNQKL